jgi:hypothetical protein
VNFPTLNIETIVDLLVVMDQTFNISHIDKIRSYSSMKGSHPNLWTCGMNGQLPHTTRDGHRQTYIFIKKIVDKLPTNAIDHIAGMPLHTTTEV